MDEKLVTWLVTVVAFIGLFLPDLAAQLGAWFGL